MIEPLGIGSRLLGPGHPPFVVAEAAINHQGDFEVARRMVYVAHALGADAIKFQVHIANNEMLPQMPLSDNFDESHHETLARTHLNIDEHKSLKSLCEDLGILYLCTAFSRDGADILEEIGVPAYKTGSGELTNLPLIEHIARKGKPVIISTGMCAVEEVAETVALVRDIGTPFMLTHCVSAYPTPYEIVNLEIIPYYRDRFQVPVGLSDHSTGIYTSLGAVALGACLLEKHFTLDRFQKGPDHRSSIEPNELAHLVKGARAVFLAMGSERRVFREEEQIVAWARESVVSEVAISRGVIITSDMVWVKRPSPGPGVVPAKDLPKVVGKKASVDIPANVQVKWEYLDQ